MEQPTEQKKNNKPMIAALLFLVLWFIGGVGYFTFPVPSPEPPCIFSHEAMASRTTPAKELWSHKTHGQVLSNPVFVGDLIVYGTLNGKLVAISSSTGLINWQHDFNAPLFAITSGEAGTIYAGTGLHFDTQSLLISVNAKDGKINWQTELPGHLEEPPVLDIKKHRLWTSGGPSGLWEIDTRDGSKIRNIALGHADTTALHYNHVLYAPFQNGEDKIDSTFYAINASTGSTIWNLPLQGQPWATPILNKYKNKILTNTGIGQIGARRASDRGWAQAISLDGKLIWETELPDMALAPNIYIPKNDMIIYTCKNGELVALNAETGEKIWANKVTTEFRSEAIALDNSLTPTIAALSVDGTLTVHEIQHGQILWSRPMHEDGPSSPAIKNNLLIVPTVFSINALKFEF